MNLKLSRSDHRVLRLRDLELDLSKKTIVMGILNVTPDSFSDGGLFFDKEKAIAQGLQMAAEGADIIDIGGESTRPGARAIPAEEELERVIPIIEALVFMMKTPISIDTNKPEVAKAAAAAGASMINNIMGTPLSGAMAETAARTGLPIVLMHIQGSPRDMHDNPVYDDLMAEITEQLEESIAIAEGSGVAPEKIIIDPGIGFGKTAAHNMEILKRLGELRALNKPILIGPSRKAFIGAALGIKDPSERVFGTAAAVAIGISNGASIIRVHDVKEMSQVSRLADSILK